MAWLTPLLILATLASLSADLITHMTEHSDHENHIDSDTGNDN